MANHLTGAQRYNNRLHRIFENAKRLNAKYDAIRAADPCTRAECGGGFQPLTRIEDGITNAKECFACRLLVGVDH